LFKFEINYVLNSLRLFGYSIKKCLVRNLYLNLKDIKKEKYIFNINIKKNKNKNKS